MYPPEAVRIFLEKETIQNCTVSVALSGGADSVCLLTCLLQWQEKFHLKLSAIHIQHHLRGEESLRDERFCSELCQKLKIPLHIISVDVKAYQEEHHVSLETSARECRYQAFETEHSDFTATAHNASDNLETILFRIARGTGLKGLCGIPPRRDRYIRPLLQSSRQEIETFLAEKHLAYITDSTNLTDDYTRNFIRHQIIPRMEEIHSHPEQSVSRMTEILNQEEAFLEQSAQEAFQTCCIQNTLQNLETFHSAVQRRCIALFLEKNHLPVSYYQICQIQKLFPHGGTFELIRGTLTAHVSQGVLCLEQPLPEQKKIPLNIGENQFFSDSVLVAELVRKKNSEEFEKIYRKFANSSLDYDIIKKPVIIHGRTAGLSLRTAGRNHTVSVKKWLQTQPVSERHFLHYLSDDAGLLWVQNLGVADRAKVTDATQTMLILHVHKADT